MYDPSRRWIAYRRRTIMHSTLKDELRILVCIQKKENVRGIFTLLQISNPTRESHIKLVVLHLVKLIGQASSFLVRHTNRDDDDNVLPNPTQSEQIFNAFKQLEQKNQESLSIQCYKGVSPSASMHNDVCSLALEKRTTLIILPFHKHWTFGRRVESSYAQRLLNSNVLKSTPCSVGILIDRGNMNNNSRILVDVPLPYRVAMLFFGGPDDREALAYARRISGHPNVTLVIIRFVSSSSCDIVAGSERSKTLDSEITSDMKLNSQTQSGRVSYTEVEVNDGMDVVGVIGSMGSMYDLIMVGRRHGDSQVMFQLKKWVNECGGIGAVGQVLASSDFKGEASVLIVQQQKRLWGLRDPEESTHLRRIGSQEVSSFGS